MKRKFENAVSEQIYQYLINMILSLEIDRKSTRLNSSHIH